MMTNEWLTPASQWGLRTWVTLAFLSLLPIGLATVLFSPASRQETYSAPAILLIQSLERAIE
jgi:hypothetical protein